MMPAAAPAQIFVLLWTAAPRAVQLTSVAGVSGLVFLVGYIWAARRGPRRESADEKEQP